MKAQVGAWEKDRQELHCILPLSTPLLLEFHPTHICNFRCNYCIQSSEKGFAGGKPFQREHMKWEVFELLVNQLKAFPEQIKMVSCAGMGEPLMHPRIVDMVRLFKQSGAVKKVQIITNASLLTHDLARSLLDAGLDQLKVSLQGIDTEMYQKVAKSKVDWNTIYDSIRHFSEIKGDCKLSVKIGDSALRDGEETRFYDLFGDICDAVGIEHIYNMWSVNGVNVADSLKDSSQTVWGLEPREIRVCRQRFTTFDVLPDGTFCLGGCHRRFGFEHNIQEVPVAEQWNSSGANKVRCDMLVNGRQGDALCRICEGGSQNWHPEDLLEGHEQEILDRMYTRGLISEEDHFAGTSKNSASS